MKELLTGCLLAFSIAISPSSFAATPDSVLESSEVLIALLACAILALLAAARYIQKLQEKLNRQEKPSEDKPAGNRNTEIQTELFHQVIAKLNDGILVLDRNLHTVQSNLAMSRLLGNRQKRPNDANLKLLIRQTYKNNHLKDLRQQLQDYGEWSGEISLDTDPGRSLPILLSLKTLRDAQGEIEYIIASCTDITAIRSSEAELQRLAYYDNLTKLPNREKFNYCLQYQIELCKRRQEQFSILFIDLDRFKNVNDALGHTIGDQLLQKAAERLQRCIRASDTLARIDGDEFAIILSPPQDKFGAEIVADKILKTLEQRFLVDNNEVFISASIGMAMFPDNGQTPKELLRLADAAMYEAKESGRRRYCNFSSAMAEKIENRIRLETDLRKAVENDEIDVYFQPQVSLQNGRLVGVEALARWHHPERGPVSPLVFIAIAEEIGLMPEMFRGICRKIIQAHELWQKSEFQVARIAVNISPKQFQQQCFVAGLKHFFPGARLGSSHIELEITENHILQNLDMARQVIDILKSEGFIFAMDDFGTGYSSLSYLVELPFDIVKIDRSFVQGIEQQANNLTIIRSIMDIARSIDLNVVVEGAETQEQLSILETEGCDIIQGYYFCKPVAADELIDWHQRFVQLSQEQKAG